MRNDEPVFRDVAFRKKKKHDKWSEVPAPVMEAPLADTHAHLQMLQDAPLALARAGAHGVAFVETIVDPAEDGSTTYDQLEEWRAQAARDLAEIVNAEGAPKRMQSAAVPQVRIACGVHPHNAKHWSSELRELLVDLLSDERTSVLGEIGLDYHYDLSPREVQQYVFREQVVIAQLTGLPVALHVREAHDDAFAILSEVGFPPAGCLLHCYNLDEHEMQRWLDAGCMLAFGGPLTFNQADEVRRAAAQAPLSRLVTETDSPYMTPVPMRGINCEPGHVIFTADTMCQVRGAETPAERQELLQQLYDNALAFFDRPPTEWQEDLFYA